MFKFISSVLVLGFIMVFGSGSLFAAEGPEVQELIPQLTKAVVVVLVKTAEGIGSGSGFIITKDGYILTCAHVVKDAQVIGIEVKGQEELYRARLIKLDDDNDLALLKIEATNLPTVMLGNSEDVKLLDYVVAVGYPLLKALGPEATVTDGKVNAFRKADGERVFQINVPINPGNSGGPLFDSQGKVIGVINAKLVGEAITGIGFAVPINIARQIVSSVISLPTDERVQQSAETLKQQNRENIIRNIKNVVEMIDHIEYWVDPINSINNALPKLPGGDIELDKLTPEQLNILGDALEVLDPEIAAGLGKENTKEDVEWAIGIYAPEKITKTEDETGTCIIIPQIVIDDIKDKIARILEKLKISQEVKVVKQYAKGAVDTSTPEKFRALHKQLTKELQTVLNEPENPNGRALAEDFYSNVGINHLVPTDPFEKRTWHWWENSLFRKVLAIQYLLKLGIDTVFISGAIPSPSFSPDEKVTIAMFRTVDPVVSNVLSLLGLEKDREILGYWLLSMCKENGIVMVNVGETDIQGLQRFCKEKSIYIESIDEKWYEKDSLLVKELCIELTIKRMEMLK